MTPPPVADALRGDGPARPRPRRAALPFWLVALIALCCLLWAAELALSLGPAPGISATVQRYGAFWPQLLRGGAPAFPGQQITMFLSYGLLHAGLAHLAMNMISLAAIGRELALLVRPAAMALIYLATQIAAALAYALIAPSPAPMVGASGAVFGLLGAMVGIAARRQLRRGQPLGSLWRAVLSIAAMNIGLTLLVPGIAWQAHLGGAAAGLAIGLLIAGPARPPARG